MSMSNERWAMEPFPTLQPEVPPRPYSMYQAMMEGYDGDSFQELLPLWDAIIDAFSVLTDFEAYVVAASQNGLSVRAIGRDLGTSKSSVFRARQRAYKKLADELAEHPLVKEYRGR